MAAPPVSKENDFLSASFSTSFALISHSLFTCMEANMKSEMNLTANLMDGAKFLLVLALALQRGAQRDELLDRLARFCFLAKAAFAADSKDAAQAIQEGRHLKEAWRAELAALPVQLPLPRLRLRLLNLVDRLRDEARCA